MFCKNVLVTGNFVGCVREKQSMFYKNILVTRSFLGYVDKIVNILQWRTSHMRLSRQCGENTVYSARTCKSQAV